MKSDQALEALVREGEINPFSTKKFEGQVLDLEIEKNRDNITKSSLSKPSSHPVATETAPVSEGGGIKNIVTFRNKEKTLSSKSEAKAAQDYDEELAKLNYFEKNQSKSAKKSAKSVSPTGRNKLKINTKMKGESEREREAFGSLSPLNFDGFEDLNGIAPSKDYGEKYKSFEAKLSKLSL